MFQSVVCMIGAGYTVHPRLTQPSGSGDAALSKGLTATHRSMRMDGACWVRELRPCSADCHQR
ncbi:MAG: hypothetical protein ACI9WU_005026 [Myxococcota bacterium]